MAIEGKLINELPSTATLTKDSVVPVVIVNQGVAAKDAQKITVEQITEHAKAEIVPDQSGQEGKFLSTDGTNVSWENVADPSVFYVEDTTNITATIAPEWNHEVGTTIIKGKTQIGAADVSARGANSLATGSLSLASGIASHAEGIQTIAGSQLAAWDSAAEYNIGDRCLYSNVIYEAKTNNTNSTPAAGSADWRALGNNAAQHAEGNFTNASGTAAHAEGTETTASGLGAHAEGFQTVAIGDYSHAEGNNTRANVGNSHAEGLGTIANQSAQHVQGKYNVSDTNNTYADIIGGGTGDAARANIQTTTWTGNFWTKGTITDGSGNVLSNKIDKTTAATVSTLGLVRPDGSTITIDANGTISGAHGSGVEVLHLNAAATALTEAYETIKDIVTGSVPALVIQENDGVRLYQINYNSTDHIATFTGIKDEKEYIFTITLNDTTEVAAVNLTSVNMQKLFQHSSIPSVAGNEGRVIQYVGTNTGSYTPGYFYKCTNGAWTRINTQPETAAFADITGQPTDNTNLASALNAKQDNLTAGSHISISNNVVSTTGLQETLSPSTGIRIDASNSISATIIDNSHISETDVVINTLACNTTYQLGVVDSITISDYAPDPLTNERYEETTLYFTTGANGTTVTLPVDDSILWAMSEPPTFEANKRCIICIVNGLALTGGN